MADTPVQAALREAFNSKLSVIPQTLSQEKQTQARANIGAGSAADVSSQGTRLTAVEKKATDNATAITNLRGDIPTKTSQLTNDSGFVTKAVTNGLIPKSGERGTLTGHETAATLTGSPTININSASTNVLNTSGNVTLTFTAAAATASDVKVIALTATAATTLTITGAAWANGGSAPTWGTAGKHLVLVANFLGGRVVLNVFDNDEG